MQKMKLLFPSEMAFKNLIRNLLFSVHVDLIVEKLLVSLHFVFQIEYFLYGLEKCIFINTEK